MKPLPAVSTLVLLLLFLLPACRADQQSVVLSHDIAVSIEPAAHRLAGRCTVTIAPTSGPVTFRMLEKAAGLQVTAEGKIIPHTFSGGRLVIPAGERRQATFVIAYTAVFDRPLPQMQVSTEDPTYGVTGYIGPEGVYLGGEAGWYPEPAAPVATRTVEVSLPPGYEAVTAGERLSRRTEPQGTVSRWITPPAVGSLSLSAGRFVVTERQLGGITLATYLYPDNAKLSDRYLDAATRYLKFYQELLGPYPFKQFAVVENFIPTGYGFPSYTLIGSTVIRLPFIVDTSLPHEIVHCWWGNGVRPDYRSGNWSEGLATYLADYLLEEKKSEREGREYRQRILTDYAALVPEERDFPVRDFSGRVDPVSRSIGYGKSAMIFHMVRMKIGDRAFFAALREVFRTRLFKEASWTDFTTAFSASSGQDLAPFMAQWLDRPSGPRLALRDVTMHRDAKGWQVRGRVEQGGAVYSLAVPLVLENAGSSAGVERVVEVQGRSTEFSLASGSQPVRLRLDPDTSVFRVLSPGEIPPTVNRIKGARNLLVVMAGGCAANEETLTTLLESLGQRTAPRVREDERPADAAGRDMLICGMPQDKGLLPLLPPRVHVEERRFTVDGETFAAAGDALFVVGRQRRDSTGVTALFLPLSDEGAAASMPKITHYGKYSYLVFNRGTNRTKGTLPPEGGDGVVSFAGVGHE